PCAGSSVGGPRATSRGVVAQTRRPGAALWHPRAHRRRRRRPLLLPPGTRPDDPRPPAAAVSLTQWILLFAAAAVLVAGAGVEVARSGDELAERAGLSRLFVGMLLVALVTSLPEVVTDVSAAVGDAPDLAVGDLFGSSMANMAILAVIDLLHRQRVWPNVEIGHARVASVAIALTALAALGVLTPPGISVGWVGIDTLFLATAY